MKLIDLKTPELVIAFFGGKDRIKLTEDSKVSFINKGELPSHVFAEKGDTVFNLDGIISVNVEEVKSDAVKAPKSDKVEKTSKKKEVKETVKKISELIAKPSAKLLKEKKKK